MSKTRIAVDRDKETEHKIALVKPAVEARAGNPRGAHRTEHRTQ